MCPRGAQASGGWRRRATFLGVLEQESEGPIAERYERRSVGIISNLVFSEGERIFANPVTTAAAIDWVVHHSVILEFDVPRFHPNAAQQRGGAEVLNRQKQSTHPAKLVDAESLMNAWSNSEVDWHRIFMPLWMRTAYRSTSPLPQVG